MVNEGIPELNLPVVSIETIFEPVTTSKGNRTANPSRKRQKKRFKEGSSKR